MISEKIENDPVYLLKKKTPNMPPRINVRVGPCVEIYAPGELAAVCEFFQAQKRVAGGDCATVDLSHITGVREFGAQNINTLLFCICFPKNIFVYKDVLVFQLMASCNIQVISRICDYLGIAFLDLRREWFTSWQIAFPETAFTMLIQNPHRSSKPCTEQESTRVHLPKLT